MEQGPQDIKQPIGETLEPVQATSTIDVYWRPGCPYCERLLDALRKAKIQVVLYDIWHDNRARDFVRAHNNGNETVPTVAYHGEIYTNPKPAVLIDLVTGMS